MYSPFPFVYSSRGSFIVCPTHSEFLYQKEQKFLISHKCTGTKTFESSDFVTSYKYEECSKEAGVVQLHIAKLSVHQGCSKLWIKWFFKDDVLKTPFTLRSVDKRRCNMNILNVWNRIQVNNEISILWIISRDYNVRAFYLDF